MACVHTKLRVWSTSRMEVDLHPEATVELEGDGYLSVVSVISGFVDR